MEGGGEGGGRRGKAVQQLVCHGPEVVQRQFQGILSRFYDSRA